MPKNPLILFVEPGYGSSTWCAKSSAGLRAGAARRETPVIRLRHPAELRQYPQVRSAVLLGASRPWTCAMIDALEALAVKPVLAGCAPQDFGGRISGPVFDRQAQVERMVAYFNRAGRRRIACVGNHYGDANDELRRIAFLAGARKLGLSAGEADVFGGEGNTMPMVTRFLDHAAQYDGAVCVNDQVAVQLLLTARQRGVRVPEDLFVAGSGGLILGALTTPTLTTAMLDYTQMGVQAANICHLLEKNPDIDALCVTLPCQILCRESTACLPEHPLGTASAPSDDVPLPPDQDFDRLDRIENCLLRCDSLDFKVLRGMLLGHSAERIAAALYIAPGTVGYRAKKLYRLLAVKGRAELLGMLAPFIRDVDRLAAYLPTMPARQYHG